MSARQRKPFSPLSLNTLNELMGTSRFPAPSVNPVSNSINNRTLIYKARTPTHSQFK